VARPTRRRLQGDVAEAIARDFLESLGWRVLARNIAVGRDEIDIVALDPGPPAEIACVEVRSNTTSRFGAPEEGVVGAKVRRLYRSMLALRSGGSWPWPDVAGARRMVGWRVDLVIVEMAPSIGRSAGGPAIRHLRRVDPG
jgi:Holliday junction resolvase-like predicted endonuclease